MLSTTHLKDAYKQQGIAQIVIDELCRIILKTHMGKVLSLQEVELLELTSEYMMHIRQERIDLKKEAEAYTERSLINIYQCKESEFFVLSSEEQC